MPSSYVEWGVPDLPHVAVLWEQRVDDDHRQLVIPDPCADVVCYDDGSVRLMGPTANATTEKLPAGSRIRGLRLRPGAVRIALGVPGEHVRDTSLPLYDVVDRPLANLLSRTAFGDLRALTALRSGWPVADRRVASAVARLRSGADVDEVTAATGLSGRQLRRLVVEHCGVGPKELHRIARLHRFLHVTEQRGTPLADAAALVGWADQAHLTRDVKKLSGLTPAALLRARGMAEKVNTAD